MAGTNYGAKDVGFFLVAGKNILGSITTLTVDREALIKPTTPLGVVWPTAQATGVKQATVSQEGWFDHGTGESNAALCEREGTEQVLCLAPGPNTLGLPVFAAQGAFAGRYTRGLAGPAGVHTASALYTVSGYAEDALIVGTLAARTTAGNTDLASMDGTAGTSAGGAGYFQLQSLTLGGYTNLVVAIRHSTAASSGFADLLTFTAATATGAEYKAVAGTVNRYLSISWAWTGSGSGQTATFMAAFARR